MQTGLCNNPLLTNKQIKNIGKSYEEQLNMYLHRNVHKEQIVLKILIWIHTNTLMLAIFKRKLRKQIIINLEIPASILQWGFVKILTPYK